MHGKEAAIAPIVAEIGLRVVVPEDFDSDRFGTFTRDIDCSGHALEAAQQKIQAVLHESQETVGLASEGSFGAHPVLFAMPYNQEIVVLRDRCCGCPGFDGVEFRRGLPCSWCAHPTSLVRSTIYQCQKCQFQQEVLFPNGQTAADPASCKYCNP
jgi:hypothetical protein